MKKWLLGPTVLALGLCAAWSNGQEPVVIELKVDVDEDGKADVIHGKRLGVIVVKGDKEAVGELVGKLPSHWIGISGSTVDRLLKKHLKIDGGVLVEWVGENSPAAKAGIKVDDIVVSVQGKAVSDIATVADFVSKSKSKTLKITVLHNGDKRSIKITPAKRPASAAQALHLHLNHDAKIVGEWIGKGGANPESLDKLLIELHGKELKAGEHGAPTILRLMPGGILGKDAAKVLEGFHKRAGADAKGHAMSIIVRKSDDAAAKVTVTRDGKSWEVTDKNLNDLPEELRAKVKAILDRPKTDLKGVIDKALPGSQIRVRLLGDNKKAIVVEERKVERKVEKTDVTPRRVQIIRSAPASSASDAVNKQLEQLRKELAALRKEVRALKKD
ncbi:MAG: PDZ domain-containing protein [Pirellulaceae bacterium]